MATYDQIILTDATTIAYRAKIKVALAKQGGVVGGTEGAKSSPDPYVMAACRLAIDGTGPVQWLDDVMIFLTLPPANDAAIDTAVQAAWTYIVNTRRG